MCEHYLLFARTKKQYLKRNNQRFKSSRMWCCTVEQVVPDVWRIRVPRLQSRAWLWRWKHYGPSKCRKLLAQWHGITPHKTCIFSNSSKSHTNYQYSKARVLWCVKKYFQVWGLLRRWKQALETLLWNKVS